MDTLVSNNGMDGSFAYSNYGWMEAKLRSAMWRFEISMRMLKRLRVVW